MPIVTSDQISASRHEVEVIDVSKPSNQLIRLRLSKPEGYSFIAGQYLNLYLKNDAVGDERDLKHSFSIAAPPNDQHLQIISWRRSTPFKHALEALSPGDKLFISPAGGSFTIDTSENAPLYFFAGGIGITPVFSLLSDSANSDREIKLFWSVKSIHGAPLFEEISSIVDGNDKFDAHYFVTGQSKKDSKENSAGRIELEYFKAETSLDPEGMFYIVGSETFVFDMHSMLVALNIPFNRIKTDSFGGY